MFRIILIVIGIIFIVGLTAFSFWFSNGNAPDTDEHGDDMITKSTEK